MSYSSWLKLRGWLHKLAPVLWPTCYGWRQLLRLPGLWCHFWLGTEQGLGVPQPAVRRQDRRGFAHCAFRHRGVGRVGELLVLSTVGCVSLRSSWALSPPHLGLPYGCWEAVINTWSEWLRLGTSQTMPHSYWGFVHAQQLAKGMWFSFMKGELPKVMVFLSDFVVIASLPLKAPFFYCFRYLSSCSFVPWSWRVSVVSFPS